MGRAIKGSANVTVPQNFIYALKEMRIISPGINKDAFFLLSGGGPPVNMGFRNSLLWSRKSSIARIP